MYTPSMAGGRSMLSSRSLRLIRSTALFLSAVCCAYGEIQGSFNGSVAESMGETVPNSSLTACSSLRFPRRSYGRPGRCQRLLFVVVYKLERPNTKRKTVGRGKVEIQNQDSHFPTAQNACGARKKTAVCT